MTAASGSPGTTDVPGPCLDALQDALAAEHRAVFGYGLLGPRLAADQREQAATAEGAHETVRDATVALLAAAGRAPVGPAADYPQLFPVPSTAAARTLAVRLEDGTAAAWRFVYTVAAAADTSGSGAATVRARAQSELIAAAVRAARWRVLVDAAAASVPFPGL